MTKLKLPDHVLDGVRVKIIRRSKVTGSVIVSLLEPKGAWSINEELIVHPYQIILGTENENPDPRKQDP